MINSKLVTNIKQEEEDSDHEGYNHVQHKTVAAAAAAVNYFIEREHNRMLYNNIQQNYFDSTIPQNYQHLNEIHQLSELQQPSSALSSQNLDYSSSSSSSSSSPSLNLLKINNMSSAAGGLCGLIDSGESMLNNFQPNYLDSYTHLHQSHQHQHNHNHHLVQNGLKLNAVSPATPNSSISPNSGLKHEKEQSSKASSASNTPNDLLRASLDSASSTIAADPSKTCQIIDDSSSSSSSVSSISSLIPTNENNYLNNLQHHHHHHQNLSASYQQDYRTDLNTNAYLSNTGNLSSDDFNNMEYNNRLSACFKYATNDHIQMAAAAAAAAVAAAVNQGTISTPSSSSSSSSSISMEDIIDSSLNPTGINTQRPNTNISYSPNNLIGFYNNNLLETAYCKNTANSGVLNTSSSSTSSSSASSSNSFGYQQAQNDSVDYFGHGNQNTGSYSSSNCQQTVNQTEMASNYFGASSASSPLSNLPGSSSSSSSTFNGFAQHHHQQSFVPANVVAAAAVAAFNLTPPLSISSTASNSSSTSSSVNRRCSNEYSFQAKQSSAQSSSMTPSTASSKSQPLNGSVVNNTSNGFNHNLIG